MIYYETNDHSHYCPGDAAIKMIMPEHGYKSENHIADERDAERHSYCTLADSVAIDIADRDYGILDSHIIEIYTANSPIHDIVGHRHENEEADTEYGQQKCLMEIRHHYEYAAGTQQR